MPDRTLYYGADATDAAYASGDTDPAGGGRFKIVEDANGGTILLEWDPAANSGSGGFVSRGPIDLSGNDIQNAGAVDADSVSTGKQNNNEINLTRLVENGTYADIHDAMANEPPNHPQGTRFMIEPGDYTVSSGPYQITHNNAEYAAYGGVHPWADSVDNSAPVHITLDGAAIGANPAFEFGDGVSRCYGNQFNGIAWEATGTQDVWAAWNGVDQSSLVFDFEFNGCFWEGFTGPVNNHANLALNFANSYYRCGWTNIDAKVQFGNQADLRVCTNTNHNTTGPAMMVPNLGTVWAHTIKGDRTKQPGIELGDYVVAQFKNAEGGSNTGEQSMVLCTANTQAKILPSHISRCRTQIQADNGGLISMGPHTDGGTTTEEVRLTGANNDHNATFLKLESVLNLNNLNGGVFTGRIFDTKEHDNLSASDVSGAHGFIGHDINRGGTGNTALILTQYNGAVQYIDVTGQL